MIKSDDSRVLARESYPEPKSKQGIVTLVREILAQPGAVHKITIERSKGIYVLRWAEKNELMEEEQTLDGALRNAEIIEYANDSFDVTPFEVLFDVVNVVRQTERSFPVCWATGLNSDGLLDTWLRIKEQARPFGTDELLAIPVQRLKSLPEDVLVLCGAPFEDAELGDVNLGVKASIELIEESNEQVIYRHVDRGGSHPQERSPATGALEGHPGGSVREGWSPSNFIRQRLIRGS